MTTKLSCTALLIGLITLSLSARADAGIMQFVQIAATLHAGAQACQLYSETELPKLRAQQRSAAVLMGMRPARFDEIFDARHKETQNRLALATPAEKTEVCEDLKAFPISAWR